MTLPGGPAAKLGHRYEMWWTLSELVRMLRGETDSLRLEPPGEDDVEFIVRAGGAQEYHQAKRSHRSGKWSVATLASAGVLASIGKLLIGNCHRFVFVSGSDARELADLCEGAADAESFEEFGERFLRAEPRASSYERVLSKWGCDRRDAWDALRRVDVRTTSEHELATKVDYGLSALFLGNANDLCARLATIVENAVHRTIERTALLGQLEQAGFLLRKISGPHAARQAVVDATERYLSGVRPNLIQGALIPRTKTAEVIGLLTGERPSDCVLTGQAGSGKTGCVIEVVDKLRANGVQVLAFRLDRHMSATTTAGLGQRLGLEESPALVLNAAAKNAGAPAVLIIDQLDAVSAMSGRVSEAFDVVAQLLVETKAASIQTVVVCRAFDWHNDPRLRSLIREDNKEANLDELSLDQVREVLRKAGRDAGSFSTRQLDLLRLPQNLALFLDANFPSTTTFSSVGDLFERYWNEKRKLVGERTRGENDHWVDVIGTICDVMNTTQQLSVRKEKLDRFSPDHLYQYVSEHVLVVDGDSYAFGHESFFDYCFARLFVNKETPLTTLLTSSEQHLFRRAQVRQILTYLRSADFDRYTRELQALVSADDIRIHIKDLAFALLGAVDDPCDEEWNIWMAFTKSQRSALEQGRPGQGGLAVRAWERVFYAPSWFEQFDERELICGWLRGQGPCLDLATNYLRAHQDDWPDVVAAYLEPFADEGGDWRRRLQTVMSHPGSCRSRRHFDLFLRLLDNGTLDVGGRGASSDVTEMVYHQLQRRQPAWIPEIVARQIKRLRPVAVPQTAPFLEVGRLDLLVGGVSSEAIGEAAEKAPAAFVDHVLSAVHELAEAASSAGQSPPIQDVVWQIPMKGSRNAADVCLRALEGALSRLAGNDEDMRKWIETLFNSKTHIANHLLLTIFRGAPQRYADEAALAFCKDPWRFDCGYVDSSYWCATETLKAVVPYCTKSSRSQVEHAILAYVDPFERTKEGVRHRGWAAFNLLAAIPNELRSNVAKRRFMEWERKFHSPATEPREMVGRIVGSPIASKRTEKMSDRDWLSAIAAYPSERTAPSRLRLRGGARQLAQEFAELAQKEPERFAHLGLQLRPETNPVYFSQLLNGLTKTTVDDAAKIALCQRVFEYAGVGCGGEIAGLLASANVPLPDDALDMLVWLAVEAENVEDEWQWNKSTASGQPIYGGDIYANGINTTRGRAALAMGELILKDGHYISRLGQALPRLVRVRSAAVGSCVAHTLRAVAVHDRALGVDLFLRMDFGEERLLGTRHVHEFVRENVHREFDRLRDLIARMLRSSNPEVGRAGARLGCLASLSHEDAFELAEESVRGVVHQRLGAADVAAANVGESKCRQWCEDALTTFFVDDNVDVRKVAASCFRNIPESDLVNYEELIGAFCNGPAFRDGSSSLLYALRRARASLPAMTYLACGKALESTKRRGMDTRAAGELTFRLYQQHLNDEWTARALDLIDRLCLEEPGEAGGRLEDFER